jgi:uncharacterized protein YdeI (YjbR/CyaY-like superfamily)
MAELTKLKRVHAAGHAAFEQRTAAKSRIYSYEQKDEPVFEGPLGKKLKSNKKAWAFFCGLPPAYRKGETRWVLGAKQEATRLRRLDKLIAACESGRRR